MAFSRIEALLGFIQQKPQDPFPRYALALEYKNAGRLDEARATFDALMTAHPDYTANSPRDWQAILGVTSQIV